MLFEGKFSFMKYHISGYYKFVCFEIIADLSLCV